MRVAVIRIATAMLAFVVVDQANVQGADRALVHSMPVPPLSARATGFTRLEPARTGLLFTNDLSVKALARNRLIEDGSGVAAGDVDGDGLCDLYFCSLAGHNRLVRNLGGLH